MLPILSRNQFSIPRARLDFRGFAFDPKLQYRLTINGTSNDGDRLTFIYYWINYEFSEAFNLHFGKELHPGEPLLVAGLEFPAVRRAFAGHIVLPAGPIGGRSGPPASRPTASSTGSRSPTPSGATRSPPRSTATSSSSGTGWWDLWDNYGQGYSDLEWHDDLAFRIGNSLSFTHDDGERNNQGPLPEEDSIRLSDGTSAGQERRPGPRRHRQPVRPLPLYAIDAGLKYRGFSLNGEYYMRWLQGIEGDGALPRTNLFDHGFVAQGGYFLIPERLELIARTSQIFGTAGTAEEYAGGLNWFFKGSHNFKLTIDATKVIGAPTNALSPNYVIGDNGVLFRTQVQVAF